METLTRRQPTPVGAPITARGFHVIVDISGVPAEICEDDRAILDVLVHAARQAKTNVINSCRYHFGHNSPPGCTCFVMLDESHISAHSYADLGLLAVDIFTCGPTAEGKSEIVLQVLREWLPEARFQIQRLPRFQHPA